METTMNGSTSVSLDQPNERDPRTIDELISQRAVESGCNDPIFAYPSSGTEYQDYTPKQLNEFSAKAANFYRAEIPLRQTSESPTQVIGLLGTSHLGYLATLLGISRLGHAVLFLSTRISEEAYVSLLTITNTTTLLVDAAYEKVAYAVQKHLPKLKIHLICTSMQLQEPLSEPLVTMLDKDYENNQTAWIIHSSGSTSLPKPIFQTHRAALKNYTASFGLEAFITLPLFHAHGLSCTFRAIYAKKKIYMYNASLPLAKEHLIRTFEDHRDIRMFYAVPYALKLLGESEEGIKLLAGLDIVTSGGSACPKALGDRLVAAGVRLVSHYGTTETGQLMNSFRPSEDKDWDYLRPAEDLIPFLRMELQGEGGLYELCVKDGWPSKVATNRDDGSYATKDLFEAHPTKPNAWRYYARKDDTIVLVNGEKANPLEVEGSVREDPCVAEAVVFGSNYSRLGMFVIPSHTKAFLSAGEIIDTIWPRIKIANTRMPAHGQLSRDMIKVLPSDTTYRRTDKGTVIRAAFYRDFSKQIEAVYQEAESIQGNLVLPRKDLITWLKNMIADVLEVKDSSLLQDSTDFFAFGADSLQSTRIRNAIIRNVSTGGKSLGQNIVFDFPTPSKLADELLRLQAGTETQSTFSVEERMEAMIARNSIFKPHVPMTAAFQGEYVVVTGATGSLGAHVVTHLASLPEIAKVICLVRASDEGIACTRFEKSLRERRIHDDLPSKKVVCVPSSLGDTNLGLADEVYGDLASKVTRVIHCAWSVNFNLSLESFERDCVAGTKNLIDLCLRARRPKPAVFNFCSSVSTVARTPTDQIVGESLPASLSYAQGMGYAQSKLVTEHICRIATEQTGIVTRVLRIGQIIGDTRYGIWNPSEGIPLIFRTADTIGVLPALDENPSWLPVDTVAAAVSDISLSSADAPVVNIVNPKTFHWRNDLLPLLRAAGIDFEAVNQREWVRRLRMSNPDPVLNPPIKLVDFFTAKYDREAPISGLRYASDAAQSLSPALQRTKAIDPDHVCKFMAYLVSVWHSTAPPSK